MKYKIENSVNLKLGLCYNCNCDKLKTRTNEVIQWCENHCVDKYSLEVDPITFDSSAEILSFKSSEDFLKFVLAKPFDYELIRLTTDEIML